MERDLELRDHAMEYTEKEADIWYLTQNGVEEAHGWIIFERDPNARFNPDTGQSEHKLTAKYVPNVFHDNYTSDVYTETVKDPYAPINERRKEIPRRNYLGFGRYVSPYPGVPFMGTIWTDGSYSKQEVMDIFIHFLEDYILDGYQKIETLEEYIAQLGAFKESAG